MIEIRCAQCNRLLAKGDAARLQIKCPRCGRLNVFNNQKAESLIDRPRAATDGGHLGKPTRASPARGGTVPRP